MEPKEVVIAYAVALEKGDIPTAFSYFSTEVQWHQPGNNQFSGVKVGSDEISGMIGSMMKVSLGTFALKPNGNLMVNDNLVSMPVNFSGKIDNQVMDMSGVDLFKVEKGKITEVWLFSEDQEKEDSFWGK
jgi:hypothetical protein